MSRAFVNEDADNDRGPEYRLPDPDAPYFDEAAAWALLRGADEGDSRGAELATGCRWGEPRLAPHVETILEQAERDDDLRLRQLSHRFLREADRLK